MSLLAALMATKPQPMSAFDLGQADAAGATATVARLLQTARTNDDAAYDRIAKGMAFMLAPDMASAIDHAKFKEAFAACTAPVIVSSRPFPNLPEAQAVRISMRCTDKRHPTPQDAVADIMADNEHAFMIVPGGTEAVWRGEARH